jgi:hypothetical protein
VKAPPTPLLSRPLLPACPPSLPQGLKCLYPRSGGPGAVEVTALDLSRLDDGEFLNDTVIDFYIRWGLRGAPTYRGGLRGAGTPCGGHGRRPARAVQGLAEPSSVTP